MLARVHSFVLHGIEPQACEVEVDVSDSGLAATTIVGLPDAAVKESIERVHSALVNSGYDFPMTRLLVNLAPADTRKEGPSYDLPIALGLLMAGGVVEGTRHRRLLFAGELALDGRLRPVRGVINLALLARRRGFEGVVVPEENAEEAAVVEGVSVYGAQRLGAVVAFLNGQEQALARQPPMDVAGALERAEPPIDFAQVKGQEAAKRAMAIAAAGGHNALMIGPAGTGKTMLAKALPGILPPLSPAEAIEVTRIASVAGDLGEGAALRARRPVRTPHHTASPVSVIGGGSVPGPGEVSLAHHGVLFLDEMPEFPRSVLETLRQPLEDGCVTIARASGTVRFPADFMLVGAMNPTPGGGQPREEVGHRQMQRYLARISGPLADRIDIHVEVPALPFEQLVRRGGGGTSTAMLRDRVQAARDRQRARNGAETVNANLSGKALDELAPLEGAARELLRQAMSEFGLSARAYDKVRRVALSIADLDGVERPGAEHVAEAVGYRLLDRADTGTLG